MYVIYQLLHIDRCREGFVDANSSSFIHGGIVDSKFDSKIAAADQLYILSLPALQCVRVNYTSTSPRALHTCYVSGNSQVILIGGLDPTEMADWITLSTNNLTADPWAQ